MSEGTGLTVCNEWQLTKWMNEKVGENINKKAKIGSTNREIKGSRNSRLLKGKES